MIRGGKYSCDSALALRNRALCSGWRGSLRSARMMIAGNSLSARTRALQEVKKNFLLREYRGLSFPKNAS